MQDTLRKVKLVRNQEPRVPVLLIMDRSISMSEDSRIDILNEALAEYKVQVSAHNLASLRADTALVSFNHSAEYTYFSSVQDFSPPELFASGGTKISLAVHTALDLLEGRRREYAENGISSYPAFCILLTDGRAEHDSDEELAEVKERIVAAEAAREASFFAFAVGEADLTQLLQICPPHRPPRHIGQAENIAGVIKWVVDSTKKISGSTGGDPVTLDPVDRYLSV